MPAADGDEGFLRLLSERIAATASSGGARALVCECENPGCRGLLPLELEEYDALTAEADVFLLSVRGIELGNDFGAGPIEFAACHI